MPNETSSSSVVQEVIRFLVFFEYASKTRVSFSSTLALRRTKLKEYALRSYTFVFLDNYEIPCADVSGSDNISARE